MKKLLLKITTVVSALFFASTVSAQTAGTLTFTFTEASHATTYNGNAQHTLAVWIQTSAGVFVKTKLRYFGGGTSDHLPTWVSNSTSNVVDATTGATRSSWTTYTVSWDGKKGPAATATLQPDGVYKVAIQSTWDHGTAGTATSTYTFTKGAAVDQHTVANTTSFTNVNVKWTPSTVTGIDEAASVDPEITVYPNPTNGVFNIDYANATNIRVMNTLGVLVYETKIEELTPGTKNIDLSNFANGIYMIYVSNENGASIHKVIFNK
jgi:hypothetical protein